MRYTLIICWLLAGCLTALAQTQTQTETPDYFHQDLCWAPDSSRLVFSAMRKGRADLYTINADGSNPRRITHDGGGSTSPSWSGNGKRIAFASNRDGGMLFVMNADGSK